MNPSQNPVTNKFADYFVICGLDISSGLELDRFSGDTLHCSPLDRPYKSKVLAHYPDNVSWNIFDHEAVSMLCLPHGLHFRTQKHSLEPCFHSFITTREDGSRTYGFSLVFYEEVTDRRICSAMQTLQAMHITEVSSKRTTPIPTGSGRKSSKKSQHHGVMDGASHSTRSLPRHFKLSTHRMGISPEDIQLSTNNALQTFYDASQDSLYASKSIALVCQLPFVRAARKFLMGLYKFAVDLANEEEGTVSLNCDLIESMASECLSAELSLESHVHNLLYEVRVPQPGRSMRFWCFGEPIVVQRPSSIEEPPLFDFPLRELFLLVGGPKRLLELFTCLLLENQILLYSADYQRLMLVAESITCLLFPFTWQHVYVPILPSSLTHFLDAPVPFVMGLPGGNNSSRESGTMGPWNGPSVCLGCRSHRTKLASEANLCFVDIDSHTVQLPEDIPSFPQQQEFIAEIYELLTQFGVPSGEMHGNPIAESGQGSKSCPSCSHHRHKNRHKHGHHRSRRKHSWSHDSDSASSSSSPTHTAHEVGKRRGSMRRAAAANAAMSSSSNSPTGDGPVRVLPPYNIPPPGETPEALKKVLAIATNARVKITDLDMVLPSVTVDSNREVEKVLSEQEQYIEDLKFNNAVREVFLNRFVHIFSAYEHFVIQPDQDVEKWLSSRDSMQNFDKATFLSDQPEPHLPFLSRFIESQMFATLIDNKILSYFQEVDPNLRVFDRRIRLLRKRFGDSLVRTPSYEPCTAIKDTQLLLEKRLSTADITSPPPRSLPPTSVSTRAREKARRRRIASLIAQDMPKQSAESSTEALPFHVLPQTSCSVVQSDSYSDVSKKQVLEGRLESALERLQGQLERTNLFDGVREGESEFGENGGSRKTTVLNQSQNPCTLKSHPPFPILDHVALNREPTKPPRERKRGTATIGPCSSSQGMSRERNVSGSCAKEDELSQIRMSSRLDEDGGRDCVDGVMGRNSMSLSGDHETTSRTRINSGGSVSSESLLKTLRQPKLSGEPSPAEIAQTNWKFVEALLKDVKMRTKRMLVEKMGSEAVELGHGTAASLSGLEENTLMASLCDLLERIWSHGLQSKQGKSALWSHLLNFQELEECSDSSKMIDPNSLTPAIPSPPKLGIADLIFSIKSKNILEIATLISNFDLSSMALETDLPLPRNGKFSTLPSRSSSSTSTDNNYKIFGQSASAATTPVKSSGDADQNSPPPLPVSVTFDMRSVQGMSEIKTDIGYARAWVRLSLEKKLLSVHLRTLLSDHELLRSLYKRCAFLRCDEEKEQFLYHLLTLNAVDYFCFTNTYTNTRIPYRVVIFPARKGGSTTTSANAWVAVAGTLGGTAPVKIPKGSLEFVFNHKNLGILTTLRIGHDNTGPSPKWMVEHVILRNEITGHSYKFPCSRWLGRGVDDDSTERLLVGEMMAWQSPDGSGPLGLGSGGGGGSRSRGSRMGSREDLLEDKGRGEVDAKRPGGSGMGRRGSYGSGEMNRCSTPPPPNPPPMVMSLFPSPTQLLQYSPPSPSPSTASSNRRRPPTVPEIQQMLGDAVNSIVKYYYRQKQEKEGLTLLLCGEMGLVHCLAQVFLHGFKSTRLFGKNLYLWDYFVKVKEEFVAHIVGERREGRRSESKTRGKDIVRQYCRLIERICNSSRTLGKDGKFQLFVCLGVREHLMHRMIAPLSTSKTTLEMFEEQSFLRDPSLSTFLCQILQSLDEFEFVLENSLTKGMMDTL